MATAITRMITLLDGQWVGQDSFGNNYYTSKRALKKGKHRRWVVYNKKLKSDDASYVTPHWHGWLHYTTNNLPKTNDPLYAWQKPPSENKTGRAESLYPEGQLPVTLTNEAPIYEVWQPSEGRGKGEI